MNEFTSTARKQGSWWVVHCDQHPEAVSRVARLDQAQEHQMEAIAHVAELPHESVVVTVRAVLEPDVTLDTEEGDRLSAEADSPAVLSATRRRRATLAMKAAGLNAGDNGTVPHVSHQLLKT